MKTMIFLSSLIVSMCFPWSTLGSVINIPVDYPAIQEGINAAVDGDTVLIADGTYSGIGNFNIDFTGKSIEVSSATGPENCIIDCQEMGRGFIFQSGETNASRIQGLTVINGSADNFGGGAIYCNSSSPSIENCHFTSNQSEGYGGAIRYLDIDSGNWEMLNVIACVFENNQSNRGGGGISIEGSLNSRILGSRFVNNYATDLGGGISCWASTTQISDTVISENRTDGMGGGIYYIHGFYPVTNCLITDNEADKGGAVSGDSGLDLFNCTVFANSASFSGGAFFVTDMPPGITNSIVRNNGPLAYAGVGSFEGSYSNIEDAPYGDGCIDEDPLFATGPSGSFYLSQVAAGQVQDSPCLNSGNAAADSICFLS